MVKSRYIGDGENPTFNDVILIMGPYKPLLLGWWVYPLLYGNNGSLDPGTYHTNRMTGDRAEKTQLENTNMWFFI